MGDRLAGGEGTRVRGFIEQLCGGWGSVASILRSLIEMGELEAFRMRLEESQVHPSWYAASLAEIDPQ